MKKTTVYILALVMLAVMLSGCGEEKNNQQVTTPAPVITDRPNSGDNETIIPDVEDMMPEVDDGIVDDSDGIITDSDNGNDSGDKTEQKEENKNGSTNGTEEGTGSAASGTGNN